MVLQPACTSHDQIGGTTATRSTPPGHNSFLDPGYHSIAFSASAIVHHAIALATSEDTALAVLQQVQNPHIRSRSVDLDIDEDVRLRVEILEHEERSSDRTLLFIHGGGAATNHTIVRRPSQWLIDRDLFDRAILPDRRGNGGSSPITELMTFEDQAEDMRRMLDAMGERGPVTAMGISYGGPIALTLAALDDRIELVVLLASSPTMNEMSWPWSWLMKSGVLTAYMRWLYRREVGKAEPRVFDLDVAYETRSTKEDWAQFRQALRHMPRDRLQSLLLEFQATSDPANAEIPDWVRLDTPVLQIIGSRDETWGGELPEEYAARFPNLRRVVIPDMGHKDAVRHADVFLEALARELPRPGVEKPLGEPPESPASPAEPFETLETDADATGDHRDRG